MHAFFTLMRRELAGFLVSITGYVIIAVAVLLMGLSFAVLLQKLQATPVPLMELFFRTEFFWFILLLTAPLVTMRLFSLEKYSGTFETLMTTPVSDMQVILAKFTAAVVFYLLLWLPLLGCVVILSRFASDATALDWGTIGAAYIGILLIGCLFMSIGCFASSMTTSQIVAAMVSLAIGLSLFFISFLGEKLGSQSNLWNDILTYMSMPEHVQDFARGIVDTRHVAFYLSSTVFFLFLTYRVIESRRWK